ncbi:ketopantoate reductase family protein [Erwinia amylovora]|uniref:ketopantoate reductase family protein n=1 Tax=Erwinia amylovora TaxID=552 RepID=UPI0014441BDB|nr:2-dehydropantoate 2-reductase N-terminal domain-containing protein [Erwinia amylovora]
MRKTSVLFIGIGGIGAPIASQLISHPGISLSCLCKSTQSERGMRTITVKKDGGTKTFDLEEITNYPLFNDPKDIIILSCKAHQNKHIYQSLVKYSDENTLLLVMQNGVGIDKELAYYNFPGIIFNCVVVSCSHKISTDTVLIEQFPRLFFSLDNKQHRKQSLLLQDIFKYTDIPYFFTQETPEELMWKKFAFIICVSAATIKFPGPCSMIIEHEECLHFFKSLCHEFSHFAKFRGVDIDADRLIEDGLFRANKMPVENYSSMTLDALEHKYGELAFFLKEMLLKTQIELPNFEKIANLLSQDKD